MLRYAVCLSFAFALVGCASFKSQPLGADDNVDQEKVAAIDRAAKRSGVQVIWLNMPQKRSVKAAD
jgi:hypothetical protein